jgi:Protein of unknown function (DUF3455)
MPRGYSEQTLMHIFYFASFRRGGRALALAAALTAAPLARAQELPEALQAPGETLLLSVHAEGAQVYECVADAAGKLAWSFREPIATLIADDRKTIGRHYSGPKWALADGSGVQGKVEAKAPGATAADIAWLKLSVAGHFGQGILNDATTVQRIHTRGGALDGACDAAGALRSVGYAADYLFLKK